MMSYASCASLLVTLILHDYHTTAIRTTFDADRISILTNESSSLPLLLRNTLTWQGGASSLAKLSSSFFFFGTHETQRERENKLLTIDTDQNRRCRGRGGDPSLQHLPRIHLSESFPSNPLHSSTPTPTVVTHLPDLQRRRQLPTQRPHFSPRRGAGRANHHQPT